MTGEKGDKGDDGDDGAPGAKGDPGVNGTNGEDLSLIHSFEEPRAFFEKGSMAFIS